MNSSPSATAANDVAATKSATEAGEMIVARPESLAAESITAQVDQPSPTEPLRRKDAAWPVVQSTAEAAAQAASARKPRKAAAERAAPAKTKPAGKAAAGPAAPAAAKPAAKPAGKPAGKPKAKLAAKPPKIGHDASAAKAYAEPATGKASRVKEKLVRDSFTMPRADFALIDQLKQRGMGFKRETRKSELLRAGLRALAAMDDAALQALLDTLPKVKTGRPRKAG